MATETLDLSTWRRIEGYLEEALDLDKEHRELWLTRLAKTQPQIARAVGDLLCERDRLDERGFLLESPINTMHLEDADAPSLSGTEVGPYKIETLIGRGGMGQVWLASRSDGRFEGRYAIKFLTHSFAHQKLANRFQQEGRLLGRLTHPNIARLIDAGTTEQGKQFLVLEYVDGERVDKYCESHSLVIADRVRLFSDVVAAIVHAHSQLIVHRDLKPSNVLVTRDGVVKLLDFGIAKLLSAEAGQDDLTMTRAEDVILTPEYAAPEQLLGEMPTTATDVYQLGMLLYVMLTGSHPFQLTGSRAERIKAALEGKVPRASEFAPDHMRKALRGDLDAILAKALDPDKARRYSAAAALAEDLERYLNAEPVVARRGAAFYRTRKFIARHRYAVAGSIVAIAGLCTTSIVAFEQSQQATIERDRALAFSSRNKAVTQFLGDVLTEAGDSSTPMTISQIMARSEKIVTERPAGSPENQAAILMMLSAHYHSWGNQQKSLELSEKASELLKQSGDRALKGEATCEYALNIANFGQSDRAIELIDGTLTGLDSEPRTAASCLMNLSNIDFKKGDSEGALRAARLGLERYRSAGVDDPFDEGDILGAVAFAYHLVGKNGDANRYYEVALQKFEGSGRGESLHAISHRNNWALVAAGAGQPRMALANFDAVAKLLGDRNPDGHPPAAIYHNRAKALLSLGRVAEARASFETAVRYARDEGNKMALSLGLLSFVTVALDLGDKTAAVNYLRQANESIDKTLPASNPVAAFRALTEAKVYLADGDLDRAILGFTRVIEAKQKNPTSIEAMLGRAEAELTKNENDAALADAQLALNTATALQGGVEFSNQTGLAWLTVGVVRRQMGNDKEARSAFESAVVQLSNTVDADHPALVRARTLAEGTLKTAAGRDASLYESTSDKSATNSCDNGFDVVDGGCRRGRQELHAIDG